MAGKNDNTATIIIKRSKKGGHEAHHGGAWKVAYADFVTAMMAFFLLLWLLNATTEVQKQGISDYFSPSTVSKSTGGAGGMLGGRAIASPGAMAVRTAAPSISLNLEPTTGANEGKAEDDGGSADKAKHPDSATQQAVEQNAAEREKAEREKEDTRFEQVEQALRDAVEKSPELRELQKHLLVDRTPEGLRIQIVDQDGQPMFPVGSARMFERTQKLMQQVAVTLQGLPNKISITGHTDSMPFRGGPRGYGNWELSGDRAQASRRVMVDAGLDPARIAAVAGRADRDPLLPEDPTSPRNRRISIVLLREASEAAMHTATKAVPPAAAPSTELKRDWTGPRVK